MKALIAATMIALAGGTASADWEDAWQNPDLSNNFDGYTESRSSSVHDPLAASYPGNGDLFSGGSDDASGATGATSYDRFVRGNPDIDVCGCI
jgi:hypothetical protein